MKARLLLRSRRPLLLAAILLVLIGAASQSDAQIIGLDPVHSAFSASPAQITASDQPADQQADQQVAQQPERLILSVDDLQEFLDEHPTVAVVIKSRRPITHASLLRCALYTAPQDSHEYLLRCVNIANRSRQAIDPKKGVYISPITYHSLVPVTPTTVSFHGHSAPSHFAQNLPAELNRGYESGARALHDRVDSGTAPGSYHSQQAIDSRRGF